jgi:5-methylcytosine-specific restriction endonuclease McrA
MIGFAKPARGSALLARRERKAERKRQSMRAWLTDWRTRTKAKQKLRVSAFERDGGRCRAFWTKLSLTGGPFEAMNLHHIVPVSLGGSDELFNRVSLSFNAHRMIHDDLLDCEGDGNGLVTFTQKDRKGRIVHAWTSEPRR